ncbi:hypothetical protein [Bradyrhizobium sp. UFLA05-112]
MDNFVVAKPPRALPRKERRERRLGDLATKDDFVARGTWFAVTLGISTVLGVQIALVFIVTGGHFAYSLEAPYTHLALADQIALGNYGLFAGEHSAPSSTIIFPFLLSALRFLGLGALLPLLVNVASTVATGVLAVRLAKECQIPLARLSTQYLFVLAAVIAVALNLPGLALTGLEHSLHVAMSVAYLLGLVRFVRYGRCDWWWFVCIIVQPIIRFEAAGMLVADTLIFIAFRRYGYALAILAIGVLLVAGYSAFLHLLGLPLLPSSILARSDWSSAAVADHSGLVAVGVALAKNVYSNLNSFGAAQILAGIALGVVWLGGVMRELQCRPITKSDQVKLATLAFITFVSLAQITGGKLGWVPHRYEIYVLVLNVCGLAIIFGEALSKWCTNASWRGVAIFCAALTMIFAGYATQFAFAIHLARSEYLGGAQLHRFVTDFYRKPVAVNQLGYVNYGNSQYVLDLSGLGSESARIARMTEHSLDWMDVLMERHGIGLAIMTPGMVPQHWIKIATLSRNGSSTENSDSGFVFFARKADDVAEIVQALDKFESTLPKGVQLKRDYPRTG